jgi:8-oxo-dGTP pyrophosphatase MutT (NUDIX family)
VYVSKKLFTNKKGAALPPGPKGPGFRAVKRMKKVEVFEVMPPGFSVMLDVAGCYVENEGRLLLLQNGEGDCEPRTWGVPGGKIERGESLLDGALRELREETGIVIPGDHVTELGCLYMRKPGFSYAFHMFWMRVDDFGVRLSAEHMGFQWLPFEKIDEVELMMGGREAYDQFVRLRAR